MNNNHEISVIIPTLNEASNIKELLNRITKALFSHNFNFEIIFIDDNSSDGTLDIVHKEISLFKKRIKNELKKGEEKKFNDFPIYVRTKEGKPGKSFSIVEGIKIAKYENIAFIDADLQYPPEAIPQMALQLSDFDIVVGNRKYSKNSRIRNKISNIFKFISGKILFNFDYDTQSGLKVFKAEVFKNLSFIPTSGWTFDLEFLYRAKELGYKIKNFDINFSKRENGKSKVSLLKTTIEILTNAIKVKFKKIEPLYVKPTNNNSMLGAGIRHRGNYFITHSTLQHKNSAFKTAIFNQQIFIFVLFSLLLLGLLFNTLETLILVIGILSFIYFLDTLFNCYLILRSLRDDHEIQFEEKEFEKLDESKLPIYTILCPLYKESHMIPQFIDAISNLIWPKDKLDVMLLLEEDDIESIDLVRTVNLPSHVRAVIVPNSIPKTKPKACNFGLSFAKGEYLVIYDAEDIPDPMQLKKAYVAFNKVDKEVLCLQAKLNYHNPTQNLLTRFFTAEYSLWFDVLLTGYQSLNTTIPLGGTSNHFRTKTLLELKGWDPFNVTEDADLGVRLFKAGFRTAIIDSTTLEEANSDLKNWIRQRSRWIKGYMQTYLVHTRDHFNFLKNKGHHALLFNLILGGKIMFILINPILWIATLSYFALYQFVGPTIEKLYPAPIFYMAATSLVFGNFLYLFYYMIGIVKREQYSLVKYVFLIPLYWLFISYAGLIALYQLVFKPFYWEKTLHGIALKKEARKKIYGSMGFRLPSINFGRLINLTLFLNYLNLFLLNIKFNFNDFSYLFKLDLAKNDTNEFSVLIFNWRDTKHKWAGGAESYIQEIAKNWTENGYKVTIFSSNDHFSKRQEMLENIEVIRAGGSYTVYFWAFIYYVFKLRKNADVIVDSENGIPFFTPLYAFKPIILLIHHVHQEIFMSELKFPFSYVARFAEGILMPLFYKNRTVITVSESSKKAVAKLNITNSENINIVKPGIPDTFPNLDKFKQPTFIYLGRLKPYKNIDVAIRAFEIVEKFNKSARLLIVGDGESRDSLISLAKKINLEDKIIFHGKVDEKEKFELLSKSWVALQPSKIEGWGLTVVEANACGTPVIATNTDGLRDSIVENRTGILVKHRDIQGFATQMLSLSRNSRKRKLLSQNAYTWSTNFNWDKSSKEFLNIVKAESYKKSYAFGFKYLESFMNRITSLF